MTEIYSLTVLEPRSWKSACWQGRAVCGTVTNGTVCSMPLSYFPGWLAILGVPWLVATSVQGPPVCVSLSRFPSSKPASHWISHLIRYDIILTDHTQRPYFQIKSHSEKPEIRTSTLLLGAGGEGTQFHPKQHFIPGKHDGHLFLWPSRSIKPS